MAKKKASKATKKDGKAALQAIFNEMIGKEIKQVEGLFGVIVPDEQEGPLAELRDAVKNAGLTFKVSKEGGEIFGYKDSEDPNCVTVKLGYPSQMSRKLVIKAIK